MKKIKRKHTDNKSPKGKSKLFKKNKSFKEWFLSGLLCIGIVVASLCLVFALYIIISAPNFDKDLLYSKEATIIYYNDGSEMARIGHENRELVTYEDLPEVFIDALLATEDSRFFQHNGLDIARFIKASSYQLIGKNMGGASTLTMQLVKNTYTDDTATGIKGIIRKFTDIYMAVFKIENCYTKEEIIEFYVNSLWLGHDGNLNYSGIYGVETASQYYFGKSISELTLAESSLLVGMYQNATIYNPYTNPEGCRDRQTTVLTLMVNHGYITQEEMDAVLEIPIPSLLDDTERKMAENKHQAAIDFVIEEVTRLTGKDPTKVSMEIYTTIDPKIQDVMLDVEEGKLFTWYNDYDQEGIVITSVKDGSVVALSGGRNYHAKGLNRATGISRQPGSTAKPMFDYAPYIEHLNGSTGDYLFDDPYTYSNGQPITDADKRYQGMITMRQSLVGSRNVTALQLFQKVMAEDSSIIPDLVADFKISYGDTLYESASIGGFEGMSPLQMSAAYGVFGRGGYYIEPYVFTEVVYEDGTSYEYKPEKEKILSAEASYMITSMLIDAVRGNWSGKINVRGTEVAGKTGTTSIDVSSIVSLGLPTDTIMDSWSVTYSAEYCIALWYGYDELDPEYNMDTDEGWYARSELMQDLANTIYSTNVKFTKPSGVVEVEVERYTVPLQLASENTPEDMRMTELFKEGTEPTEVSNRYETLDAPKNGSYTLRGTTVTLNWDRISTPDAINTTYLQQYFNENYGQFASKYYEKRIADNASQLGEIGYQIYMQNSDGTLTDLGWRSSNSYTQSLEPGQSYTFVIKSAYSIFKNNASDGLTISFKVAQSTTDDDEDEDDEREPDTWPDRPSDTEEDEDTGLE